MNPYVALLLSWDLPSMFSPAAGPARSSAAHAAFERVEREVTDSWQARAVALHDLALVPHDDDDVFLQQAIDLAELNTRLEVLSGLPFPPLAGDAGRALKRLRPSVPVPQAVDEAAAHLGVGAARHAQLRAAAGFRAALPTALLSGSFLETHLDEDDFLDEVGLQRPWITKSARGRVWHGTARLAWDLPHTLHSRDALDLQRLAWARLDVALAVSEAARCSRGRRRQWRWDGRCFCGPLIF